MGNKASIIRVIDGDTVEAIIFSEKFYGVTLETEQILRLARIDAPEVTGKEKKYGLQAESAVRDLIERVRDQDGTFEVEAEEKDSFGRYIAEIYLCANDGPKVNLSDWMVTVGFAEYKEY